MNMVRTDIQQKPRIKNGFTIVLTEAPAVTKSRLSLGLRKRLNRPVENLSIYKVSECVSA